MKHLRNIAAIMMGVMMICITGCPEELSRGVRKVTIQGLGNFHDTVFTRVHGSDSIRVVAKGNVINAWVTWPEGLSFGTDNNRVIVWNRSDSTDIDAPIGDNDRDGVPNDIDACPNVPGLPPDGCPIVLDSRIDSTDTP